MKKSPSVYVLIGLTDYVGEIATSRVLGVYSNYRTVWNDSNSTESDGWNDTWQRPATENDSDLDRIIQYDRVEVVEKPLIGAEKVIKLQAKKR